MPMQRRDRARSILVRETSPHSGRGPRSGHPAPAGALLGYAAATQQSSLNHVRTLAVETASEYLALDAATRRNLEITETCARRIRAHVLSLLDTCSTPAGSRILRYWLTHPLRSQGAAAARHGGRSSCGETTGAARRAGATSSRVPAEVELQSPLAIAIASARPRTWRARDTLRRIPAIAGDAQRYGSNVLASLAQALTIDPQWAVLVTQAIRRGTRDANSRRRRDRGRLRAELDELRPIDDTCGEFLVLR